MINAKVNVSNVDYKASLGALLPKVLKIVREKKSDGIVGRFLSCMGDDLVPFAQKVMDNMADAEKEELLIVLLHANRGLLKKLLNKILSGTELADSVDIGRVDTCKEDGKDGFSLVVSDLRIDYAALMDSGLVTGKVDQVAEKFGSVGGLVKGAAKAAMFLGKKASSDTLEKSAVKLLEQPSVHEKLLKLIRGASDKFGLRMDADLSIMLQDGEAPEDDAPEALCIPPEAENIVFAMLKRYMQGEA